MQREAAEDMAGDVSLEGGTERYITEEGLCDGGLPSRDNPQQGRGIPEVLYLWAGTSWRAFTPECLLSD